MRGAPSEEANTPKSSWRSFGEWCRRRRRSARRSADVASPVRIVILVEWEPVMVFCAACADAGLISMAVQLRVCLSASLVRRAWGPHPTSRMWSYGPMTWRRADE